MYNAECNSVAIWWIYVILIVKYYDFANIALHLLSLKLVVDR